MTELRKLIEAVERGGVKPEDFRCEPFYSCKYGEYSSAVNAYHGSLDAAKALHEALLPGWHSAIIDNGAAVSNRLDGAYFSAKSTSPARAWLLAILHAVKSREAE